MVFPSRGNALTRGNGMKEREKNVCKLVCIFYDFISHVYFNSKRNGFSFKDKAFSSEDTHLDDMIFLVCGLLLVNELVTFI